MVDFVCKHRDGRSLESWRGCAMWKLDFDIATVGHCVIPASLDDECVFRRTLGQAVSTAGRVAECSPGHQL